MTDSKALNPAGGEATGFLLTVCDSQVIARGKIHKKLEKNGSNVSVILLPFYLGEVV